MGNFSKEIRRLSIVPAGVRTLTLDSIKVQYNPYRFKHWESLHEGPSKNVLDIYCSPHVRLLTLHDEEDDIWGRISQTAYYQMQYKYGRRDKWIRQKIRNFLHLYNELKMSPVLEGESRISVMQKPIRENPYNDGFEVFEGHHRIACLCKMRIQDITVVLLRKA